MNLNTIDVYGLSNLKSTVNSSINVLQGAIDQVLPNVTQSDNGSLLQVVNGNWGLNTGIDITDLNNISNLKNGCIYKFDNSTVINRIPIGYPLSVKFTMMTLMFDGGNIGYIAISSDCRVYVRGYTADLGFTNWIPMFGTDLNTIDFDLNDHTILNVQDPIQPKDIVNKQYVDNSVGALSKLNSVISTSNGYVVPIMTSNTSPSPYIITQSSAVLNLEGYRAFDRANLIYWGWNTLGVNWLQVQLPSPVIVSSVEIVRKGQPNPGDITNVYISASNDGVNFTTLTPSPNGVIDLSIITQTINLANNTAYSYYRLNLTANTTVLIGISQFNLLTKVSNFNGNQITNVATPINSTDAANKAYVDTAQNLCLPLDGTRNMVGTLNMNTNKIISVVDPTAA